MDTRSIFKLLTFPIGKPIETILVNNAKNILKPRVNAQPPDQFYLAFNNSIRTIKEIKIKTDRDELIAHEMRLLQSQPPGEIQNNKKAMVYLPGNCPFITDSLPNMESLITEIFKNIENLNISMDIVCYCQHYRGRGSNQQVSSENFNDYTQLEDAKDQAALIKTLIEKGYKPEDIFLIGYSYGSAVLISAVYYLVTNYGPSYLNLKSVSDRGYGNLFDFRFLKPLIYDQEIAHKRIYEKEMLPEIPFHDIVKEYMPESFIFYIENDKNIWFDFSLANTFQTDELAGRIMSGEAKNSFNAHIADRRLICLKTIPELKFHHLMTAILTESPIKIQSIESFCEPFLGYKLFENAEAGDENFLTFPPLDYRIRESSQNCLMINTKTITILLNKLHEYCVERASRAIDSGYGASYKRAWVGSSGLTGWTAKEQIQMAMRIMVMLYDASTHLEDLRTLVEETGPHQSGELNIIFEDVMSFAKEFQQLQDFNEWITSMPMRRAERLVNSLDKESIKNNWVIDDDTIKLEDLSGEEDNFNRVVSM